MILIPSPQPFRWAGLYPQVGNAPHEVLVSGDTAYVSNQGGRKAKAGKYTNDSVRRSSPTRYRASPAPAPCRLWT